MRASKTLVSMAAAAAIVSVIGLAYAETSGSATGDTQQMQVQTRNDTSTAPAGTMQPSDTPASPALTSADATDGGNATPADRTAAPPNGSSNSMGATGNDTHGSVSTDRATAAPAAGNASPRAQGPTGAATDINRSNNNGDYNASSNAVAPADNRGSFDDGSAPAERPAKPDRN